MPTPIRVRRLVDQETRKFTPGSKVETWYYMVEYAAADTMTASLAEAQVADDGTTAVVAYGTQHAVDAQLYATDFDTRRDGENPNLFYVTVTWRVPTTEVIVRTGIWNVEVELGDADVTEPIFQDLQGLPIVSTAGEPYNPALEKTYSDDVLTITFSTDLPDTDTWKERKGKVNDDTVTLTYHGVEFSYTRRQLKLVGNAAKPVTTESGWTYFNCTLKLAARFGAPTVNGPGGEPIPITGYSRAILDQGSYWFDPTETDEKKKKKQFKDKYGETLDSGLLDGNGLPLFEGDAPVFNVFEVEEEADFSALFTGMGL